MSSLSVLQQLVLQSHYVATRVKDCKLCTKYTTINSYDSIHPTGGSGGIMFSGCPSVSVCVRARSEAFRPACHRPIVARIACQSGVVTGQPNACYTVVNFRNVTFRSYGSKLWLLWSSSRVIFQIHLITDGFSPTGTPVLLIVSWNELPTVDRLLSRVTESADRLIQL